MGYGSYDTPRGMAGYNIESVCDHPECGAKIDRGLDSLCGDQPGYTTESGCGNWFCGMHLFGSPFPGGWICGRCLEVFEAAHPEHEWI